MFAIFEKIKRVPEVNLKEREILYMYGFRYLPNKYEIKGISLEIYNYERISYEGPIVIEYDKFIPFESERISTFLFDKPYVIGWLKINPGENSYEFFEKEKEEELFMRKEDCIETPEYKMCGNEILVNSSRIGINYTVKDWGNFYISFSEGVFLPNAILIFFPLNVSSDMNYTIINNGYKLYNGSTVVFILGNVTKINSTYEIQRGILAFVSNQTTAEYMLNQIFYIYKLNFFFGKTEDTSYLCYEYGLDCYFSEKERETQGYYTFSREKGKYNFITKISNNTIGWGEEYYSIRGIWGLSKEEKGFGERKKENVTIRIFDKELFMQKCKNVPYEWYSGKAFRGINNYISFQNISGNFYINILSTGDFWINTTDTIYEVHPEKREVIGNSRLFLYNTTFIVNRSVRELTIPAYSTISGEIDNISWVIPRGEVNVSCSYCKVYLLDGPVKVFEEIVSEKSYNISKGILFCEPNCNMSLEYGTWYKGYIFCPEIPSLYLRMLYLYNESFSFPYNISYSPFSINGVGICIDNVCNANVISEDGIMEVKIENCSGIGYPGKFIIKCPGRHGINFTEEPINLDGYFEVKDKFIIYNLEYSNGSYYFTNEVSFVFYDPYYLNFQIGEKNPVILGFGVRIS